MVFLISDYILSKVIMTSELLIGKYIDGGLPLAPLRHLFGMTEENFSQGSPYHCRHLKP